MSDNQEAILDNHCHHIFNCLITIVYCLVLLLVAFKIIHSFLVFVVVIIGNAIKPIAIKRIKQYHQKQPPTPKAINIVRVFYYLFYFVLIGIGVFCFYNLIFL